MKRIGIAILAIILSASAVTFAAWRERLDIKTLRVKTIQALPEEGNTTVTQSSATTMSGAQTFSSTMAVAGASTLTNTAVTGTLNVRGTTTCTGAVQVVGAAALNSTLAVTGASTLYGSLEVNGTMTLGTNGATGLINTSDWDIDVNGNMSEIGTIDCDGVISNENATAATSTITGAIVTLGGIGAVKNIHAANFVTAGEATVDGKYAVVGGDASTALMIQAGDGASVTNGATVTFPTVFGSTPVVVIGADESTATVPYPSSVTPSNFVVNGEAAKVQNWVAVGTRP